jgi:Cu-Zn family superoxide dismutase
VFPKIITLSEVNERKLMRKILSVSLFLLAAFVTSARQSHSHAVKSVTVEFKNVQGQNIGTATLTPAPQGVRIKLDLKDLPPGDHSIHIHQFAKCEPPDFKSAGAHFDPSGMGHSHDMPPAGDIPDFALVVGQDGTAHATTIAPNVTLGSDANSVFSNGGTSIVIHASSGTNGSAAPARIACGVITRPE